MVFYHKKLVYSILQLLHRLFPLTIKYVVTSGVPHKVCWGEFSTAIYRNVAYIQTAATFMCRGKLSCLHTNLDAFQHQHFQQHKFELCATFFDTALELLGAQDCVHPTVCSDYQVSANIRSSGRVQFCQLTAVCTTPLCPASSDHPAAWSTNYHCLKGWYGIWHRIHSHKECTPDATHSIVSQWHG